MPLRFNYGTIYVPPVEYKKLYHDKFSDKKKMDPYEKMEENCKYAIKIAEKLVEDCKYEEAIHYYEEALKLGGNKWYINNGLSKCRNMLRAFQKPRLIF